MKRSSLFAFRVLALLVAFAFQPSKLLATNEIQIFKNPPERPNIVIIFTDDQGMHDVGCFGSEIPTPNIDTLARDGVKLTQFYAASSICTPSRFGLLTGMNPSRSQDRLLSALMFLEERDSTRGIQPQEQTLADVLTACGYDTALIGKWHLGHGSDHFRPIRHGFASSYGHTGGCIDFFTMRYGIKPDWYKNGEPIDETGYATDLITDEAIRYIEDRGDSRPFFLFLPYNAPHFGKGWDDGKDQTVNLLQPHPRDLGRVSNISEITRRKYAAKVVALDDGIGRVLRALEQNHLEEDTLVIFMTDHGGDPNYGGANEPFRDGKATLFEGGIRVPCLFRWKGVIDQGTVCNAPISALDLLPTLTELAGGKKLEQPADGISLLAPIKDLDERELFWELGAHPSLQRGNWLAFRKGPWKLIINPNEEQFLFNIIDDPGEEQNLAHQSATRLDQLKKRALQLSQAYRRYSNGE